MMKMNNTQTIEVPDALKAKMAAEAAEAEPIAETSKREVSDEEWEAQMPKPSGYRLLIALPDVEEYYQGSTLLKTTDQMHKEYIMSIMGIVIDMGADAYSDKDRFPEGPWCKEGDYVMFRMNTGTRFKVNGKEFRLMNDDSVEAVIPDPRGIMAV
jgi:co-chaperonin GroES (HSP10)|tara:strand:- start:1082 stop:1546 length:465 start_codon:yes stop_codon:yes gene_type:complete